MHSTNGIWVCELDKETVARNLCHKCPCQCHLCASSAIINAMLLPTSLPPLVRRKNTAIEESKNIHSVKNICLLFAIKACLSQPLLGGNKLVTTATTNSHFSEIHFDEQMGTRGTNFGLKQHFISLIDLDRTTITKQNI